MSQAPSLATIERLAVLALGALIVFALVYVILSGRPLPASQAAPMRLLLALAASVFGAFLPGAALRIGYQRNGLAVRAAGAAAFFVLVWLGGPRVAPGLTPEPPVVATRA
jgi:hypothetical protein